ncbi:MAG: bifunctional riboflavin kinase/FAD synthetase [candidate division WOR-3 bacterium]|nr:bifunctional riboflavin kinase/FAD synthetase [candidate division WOR-3 bacterium]
MQIYPIRAHQHYPEIEGAIITIGSFDGLHRGHQKILRKGMEIAQKLKKPFGVITFTPIPQMIIYKDFHFLLTTDEEKIKILEGYPIDFLGFIKFTPNLKQVEPKSFIANYIVNPIRPSVIVVGEDHQFGKEGKGNISLLRKISKEFNFELVEVSALKYHSAPIKSTRIRELLILGNVKRANELLGYPYALTGKVIKGKGLGRKIGFPTLNLLVKEKMKLIPADGVYHINALIEHKRYNGLLYIGSAPTINIPTTQRTIEVHLLGIVPNFQPKTLTVEFLSWLRPERKFSTIEELRQQITTDVKKIERQIK